MPLQTAQAGWSPILWPLFQHLACPATPTIKPLVLGWPQLKSSSSQRALPHGASQLPAALRHPAGAWRALCRGWAAATRGSAASRNGHLRTATSLGIPGAVWAPGGAAAKQVSRSLPGAPLVHLHVVLRDVWQVSAQQHVQAMHWQSSWRAGIGADEPSCSLKYPRCSCNAVPSAGCKSILQHGLLQGLQLSSCCSRVCAGAGTFLWARICLWEHYSRQRCSCGSNVMSC